MSYTLTFTSTAFETYYAITAQLQGRWGDKIVADFERKTVKVLELITVSPLIFQSIESNPNLRKGLIHKNCSVFYEVQEFQIEILFFWDNRQDPLFR